ncbi:MAG: redoxin domain-containing protein [Actinomycetota bacterium]|nr:redoxin domain-containing protein [Actinomycetota bacterium]
MTEQQDRRALATEMTERLRAEGTTPGLDVGTTAPDFSLPDADGRPVSLAERLAAGPVVLSFYRGAWCPVCNTEMQALQEALPDIERAGARLLAVSPQAPDASQAFVQKLSLGFDVLSDLGQDVIRAYRLQFELPEELRPFYRQWGMALDAQNADGSWNLPVPATFVIDRSGTIVARHVDPDYRQRMAVTELLSALEELQSTQMEGRGHRAAQWGWIAVASLVFVIAAMSAEVLASAASAGAVPAWASLLVPPSWPVPARVVWWLAVAGAALVFRLSLHSLGFRQRPTVVALSSVPFLVFAAGIAAGADWATWH